MTNSSHAARVEGRMPPHDLQAEAAAITTALLKAEDAAAIVAAVRPEHFYSGGNRALFEAISFLVESGAPCDLVTASSRLRDTGRLAQVGGAQGLIDLTESVPAFANPIAYARKVRELARLRDLLLAAQKIEVDCYHPTDSPAEIMARAERSILGLTEETGEGESVNARDAGLAMCRTLESAHQGVLTGFDQLDDLTAGLNPGELTYLGARPGMGKTAWALEVALRVAERGVGVLVISLEMSAEALMQRAVSARARVPLQAIRHRQLSPPQWSRLTSAMSVIAELPLRIYDKPASLRDVAAHARRSASLLKRAKLGLVIVDHVGLILPSVRGKANREQEVAEISRGLKNLARSLGVPIIALAQVGRDVEKGSRRPQLRDLRESGSLEQDADLVIALHRPAYYDLDADEQLRRYAELIVLKQRNGSLGIVPLEWDAEHVAFNDARN